MCMRWHATYKLMTVCRTTALFAYEYIVTLDQEINHIWAKKWSFSTLIFAVNRYISLFLVIVSTLSATTYTVSVVLYDPLQYASEHRYI
jgi:hypothetical protein